MLRKDIDELEKRGDWYFNGTSHMGLKYGDGEWDIVILPINNGGWNWNMNKEKPTLSPSILVHGSTLCAAWHGYLRDGVLIDA